MSEIYEVIGTSAYEPLLCDPAGGDVIAVAMLPGQGAATRGALICKADGGMWKPALSTDADGTKQLAVLAEDVNTGTESVGVVAEDAAAYRAGRFIRGRVKFMDDDAIDAEIELVLRQQGIVFDPADDAPQFKNDTNRD